MNASEIIKSIEAEQLKAEVPQFNAVSYTHLTLPTTSRV